MCRNLVTQSYDNELSSQQSEAKLYSDKIIVNLHQQILERLVNCGLSQADLRAVQNIINDVLVGHIPESAAKETIKNMSATSMMLYQRLIAEVFQSITQRIDSLVNHVDAQESELMSLDAHLGAADEKTLAMQLFDALKSVEGEKALADAEYQRQLDSIESLKRQREMLVAKRIQLIKAIAEKEQANDDNARIVKYAATSLLSISSHPQETYCIQYRFRIFKCAERHIEQTLPFFNAGHVALKVDALSSVSV